MGKAITAIALLVVILFANFCNDQFQARSWGGSTSVKIRPGDKLQLVTWKGNSLWVLSRPMKAEEKPENYTFQEHSPWGILEGTVIVKEEALSQPSNTSIQLIDLSKPRPEMSDEQKTHIDYCLHAKGETLRLCRENGYVK